MQRNTKILAAKIAVGLAVIPILIWAHAAGPDPRRTGAPGDKSAISSGTCVDSGCHVGPLNPTGGSVSLSTSTGATYTPGGPAETITITITDPKETFFGFQLTSRIDSSPVDGQAGDFTAGTQQIVICDDGSLKTSKGCVIPGDPVQFIEHSFPFPKGTITVSWTPPATNVGTVTLYVAANAATQIAVPTGSHVYTSSLQLTPTGGGNTSPTISSGGVVSASAFSAKAGVAPGTWLEIYGGNLSTTTRSWAGSDFNGNNAPTSLDGVMSVTIGGVNAYIDFISPGQVNVQVPDGIPLGAGVPLVLTNSAGSSAPYTLQTAAVAPALLAPATAPFMVGSRQYVVAQQTDLTFTGMPSHPAKAGDVLTIYGIGFGPVTPTTGAGVIATQATSLTNKVTFLFGQTPGTILYQGLAPSNVGLYQFNVQVPTVSAGDSALTVMTGSTKVSQNLFVNIGH